MIITPLGTVSPYLKGDKNCSGYLIENNNKKYLFDCGNGITKLMKFPEDLINLKIFITHLHPDHYGDLSVIAQTLLVYKRLGYINENIDVYIPNDINNYHYFYLKEIEKNYPINIIDYNDINFNDDHIIIKSFKTLHDIPSYSFKIISNNGVITYSGDTGYFNEFIDFVSKSDIFICESTFLKGQNRIANTHLYAYEAANIASLANVKKLILTHFWPEIDKNLYLNEAKNLFDNTEVAIENKKIILNKNY